MLALLILVNPERTQSLLELAVAGLQETASAHPLALLLSTLGLTAIAFLLTILRVSRPLPGVTRWLLLTSILLFMLSLAWTPVLMMAGLGWASVVLLLLLDEFLLLRNQRRQHAG